MQKLLSLVLIILLTVTIGCKKDESTTTPTDNTPAQTHTGTITIDVGSGLNPTYTWSGAGINTLTVTQLSGTIGPVWGITSSSGTNSIGSPVTNGTAPGGAIESFTAGRTLTAGASYTVQVMRLDATFGTTTFTR
jgi:hypothetical protein